MSKIQINGGGVSSGSSGGGTPGGNNTEVQFNDSGSFGGDADLTWNKTTNVLSVGGEATFSPPNDGIVLGVALESGWTEGTILSADTTTPISLTGNVTGTNFDFFTNITPVANGDIIGNRVEFPSLTQSTADATFYVGYYVHDVKDMIQDTLEGEITWYGAYLQLPNITQTTGTVNSYGVRVLPGTVNSGTAWGFYSDSSDSYFGGINTFRKGILHIPTVTGTLYDFQLETEWTTGTLINADFGSATTLTGNAFGSLLNFNTNVTGDNVGAVIGYGVALPDSTNTAADISTQKGLTISKFGGGGGNALVQNNAGGETQFRAIEIEMPSITQTAGLLTADGIYINGGTITSGTQKLFNGLITQTQANIGAINVATTLGADVDGVAGFKSSIVGLATGGASGNGTSAYEAVMTGDAQDTNHIYRAYKASNFTANGTNEAVALDVGTGYLNVIEAISGDVTFYDYNPTIQVIGLLAGNTLTIKAGDGQDAGATPRIGGDLVLSAGSGVNGGANGVVNTSYSLDLTPTFNGGEIIALAPNGWSEGTGIGFAFDAAETITGNIVGIELDLQTNVTANNIAQMAGISITTPSANNTGAGTYANYGLVIGGGDNSQATLAGATSWSGIDISLPTNTQSAGTAISYGINLTGGTINSGSQRLIVGAITQTTTNESAITISTTIGADVGGINGISSSLIGLSTGSAADASYDAYDAGIFGNANDTAVNYTAFQALNAIKNGGTSTTIGFGVGTDYDYATWFESGTLLFEDYNATIEVLTASDGAGNSLTIKAGDAVELGVDHNGGNIIFNTGTATGAGVKGTYSFKAGGTEVVTIGKTGEITITPWTNPTRLLDFNLNSTWVNGTIIGADFSNATSFNNPVFGAYLDLNTNVTATNTSVVFGYGIFLPNETNTGADNYSQMGLTVSGPNGTRNTLVQNTAAGTTQFRAVEIELPNITQTTGTLTSDGIYINGGTITSGTQRLFNGLITQTQASIGSVNVNTTLGADVDGVTGILSTVNGLAAGGASGNGTFAFGALMNGDAQDTDHTYTAFSAIDFTSNGGTNDASALDVWTGYGNIIWALSGTIDFADYAATIRGVRETDGAGDNLTIQAADGLDSGATARNGGDLVLSGGAKANAGVDGKVRVTTRFSYAQGTDAASATNLALAGDGNVFELTGTTKVDLISSVGWQDGSIITLIANESVVIDHGTATSGTNITIKLAGAVDYSMTADDTLTLVLSTTTAGGQAWREVSRAVI